MQRIQGAFITEAEIAKITEHWSEQGEPDFAEELLEAAAASQRRGRRRRRLRPRLATTCSTRPRTLVVESGTASVSMIQRRLRVGYTRAGRLIDMLERRGIISGYEGSKPRQVLVSLADLPRVLGGGEAPGKPAGEVEPEPVAAPRRRVAPARVLKRFGRYSADNRFRTRRWARSALLDRDNAGR